MCYDGVITSCQGGGGRHLGKGAKVLLSKRERGRKATQISGMANEKTLRIILSAS